MGVIQTGKEHLTYALDGGRRVSSMESQRNATNEQLKQAERNQTLGMAATGAGAGAAIAMMAGGPVGWAAGAGLAVGAFLGEVL